MTTYRWSDDDLHNTVEWIDGRVKDLSYKFHRVHGLVERLQQAITEDCRLALDSVATRKLKGDARVLRRIAGKIDRAVHLLTRDQLKAVVSEVERHQERMILKDQKFDRRT